MPEPAEEDDFEPAADSCPNCGAQVSPGSGSCPSCGFGLAPGAPMADAAGAPGQGGEDTFEDEDIEGRPDSVDVSRCPRCGEVVDETQTNCRRCNLELRPPPKEAGPASTAVPPPAVRPDMAPPERPAPPPENIPPGAVQPSAGVRPPGPAPTPGPVLPPSGGAPLPGKPAKPAAPPKPTLASLPPEERRRLREKYMRTGLYYLLVLGIADLVVAAVPLLWTNIFVNAGMVIANFIIIGGVVLKAQRHLDAGRSEMSPYERTKVSRVMIGLVVIMIVPLHEVLGIFAFGYYSASWSASGWTGLFNPGLMLIGALFMALNIQQSRERIGYFAIWRNGALLLLLAPAFAAIQLVLPMLISPEWFHATVGLMCGTVMLIALLLKGQRDKQFKDLEDAIRAGDELAARGQLDDAKNRYDVAISLAHTLYSHLIFNPGDPYAQAKVPQSYSEPWFKKGRVLAKLKQHKKALAIFDMILEIDPVNQIALLNEAEIMTDMGDFAGALRAVDRVLRIVPDHPDALRMRGSIAASARKAAEQAERESDAETVFNVGSTAPAGPAQAPPPQTTEFTEAG